MNYRHVYHAGNHADVLKHAALLAVLARMMRKETPLAVIETHAGLGVYDLASAEAQRSPEWREGIGRLMEAPPLPCFAPLVAAVQGLNADGQVRFYPGSPALVAGVLRDHDRYVGCELHPEDAVALKARYSADRRMHIHARDGWEALGALVPPPEKRGLVVIDPPYEQPGELARGARAIGAALARFGHGVFLWWRPLKDLQALERADSELLAQGAKGGLEARLWLGPPMPQGRLLGSSVMVVNPPFGLEEDLRALCAALPEALGLTSLGGASVHVLGRI